MALTDSLSEYLRTLAGPDFTYPGVPGAGRPANRHPSGGSPRKGLKAWLLAAQGNVCPCCGDALALADAQFSHVAARGPKVSGFIAGNVYAGCAAGNARMAPEWANGVLVKGIDVQRPADLSRPDLVPSEWPCATTGGFRVFDPEYAG